MKREVHPSAAKQKQKSISSLEASLSSSAVSDHPQLGDRGDVGMRISSL
jgi:hypothetical protein